MEKVTLCGMEGDIDPRAIAAQGRTLTHLTLQGFKPPRKGGICTPSPQPLLTLDETLDMCAGLPELRNLQIDATCDDMLLVSNILFGGFAANIRRGCMYSLTNPPRLPPRGH